MRKKFLSALLVLCMALTLLPMSALAAKYTVNFDGQKVEIEVNDTTGEYQKTQLNEYYAIAPGTITLDTNQKMPQNHEFAYYYGEAPEAYTIQGSLVNLPAVEEGTEVEASGDGSATASNGTASAKLPAELGTDKVDLSSVTVGVKPADTIDDNKIGTDVNADIKTAIKTAGTKFVEVTIKPTAGTDGDNLFKEKDALKNTPITISIGGLVSGKDYYLFCVMDDGTVTSYGFVRTSATTISFTTKHLCVFGATPVENLSEAQLTALKDAVANDKENHESGTTVTGGNLTAPGGITPSAVNAKWEAVTAAESKYYGGKLTITGLDSKKTYLVRLDNGIAAGNVKPSACYVISGKSSETLSCQPSMNLMIFEIADGATVNTLPTGDGSNVFANIYYRIGNTNNGTAVKTLT